MFSFIPCLGSLDTVVAASPSHYHLGILLPYIKGVIRSDRVVIKFGENNPRRAIKGLFVNACSVLLRILGTHYDSIKQAALRYVRMEQVSATEEEVEQANNLEALFRCLKIDEKWNDVHFLSLAILCPPTPSKEQEAACMVLEQYLYYLETYSIYLHQGA